ncbi:hypothetical protein [Adlercreutzia caecimuris]|jgi:hypothetical protein|uniref:hypothetical protein n=1 Tax=Adlercreutzia caecimuris TaxID=671266 RepID=UPI00242E2FD5|nr:hypothetical protein [Adlercreutzia caecimuris]MCI9208755.1 hypothetical protein [Adlercreutzia caecimuris]
MIKNELFRAFANRYFLISLGIGVTIAVAHIFQFVIPDNLEGMQYENLPSVFPNSAFSRWMGAWGYPIHPDLFYFLSPVLATLPFGWSLCSDSKNGYLNQIYTRGRRGRYLAAKALALFVSGGTAVAVPLIVNFVGTACVLPMILPDPVGIGYFMVLPMSFLGELYFENALLYNLAYYGIIFLAGGLMALLAIPLSLPLSNKILAVFAPFAVCTLLAQFTTEGPYYSFAPTTFMRPGQDYGYLLPDQVLAFCMVVVVAAGISCWFLSRKDYVS